ncbi:hypothetical protein [Achromobacter sp. 2789STDY5608628]|uniref:hypothetical protein n=1 Tax=Achromobacter sp. 2789STDY5608628 TaxID=1806493 RepID=UPI0006C48F0D|nr:hypothetical protein [Achromobacter sp. 2789STDY5608628]CUJ67195.1 Uncharacterised protein [Achromobacter sp. 2789STDY5608628]
MKLTFIQGEAALEAEFPQLLPIFERLPVVPEYRPAQLLDLALRGAAHIGRIEDEAGALIGAMAFEFINYPGALAVNIIALAGERLDEIAGDLFGRFKQFCRLAGADIVEARCGEGMSRMLQRYGFGKAYNVVRANLGD